MALDPSLVRLRSPKSGKTYVVDPSAKNVPAMLGDGWTRVGTVTVAAHARAFPSPRNTRDFPDASTNPFTQEPAPEAPAAPPQPREEPWLVKNLPGIGGAAGGILGGLGGTVAGLGVGGVPGAVGGAAVGGAGGEAVRQLIDRAIGIQAPETALDALGNIGKEGAVQGALELGGHGLAKGVALGGKTLMGAALKFTPEVAQTAVREGITATRQGFSKLLTKLGEYGTRTDGFIKAMSAQGIGFDPVDLLKKASPELQAGLDKNLTGTAPEVLARFKEFADKFMSQWGTKNGVVTKHMTPEQLQLFKKDAQEIADPIFTALNNKEQAHLVTPADKQKATFFKAMATAAQRMLEEAAPDMVDPVTGKVMTLAESNAQTGALIKLKDIMGDLGITKSMGPAAKFVANAVPRAAAGATVGGFVSPHNRMRGIAEGATMGAIATPEVLSWLALRLNSPALANALVQTPRALGAIAAPPRDSLQ